MRIKHRIGWATGHGGGQQQHPAGLDDAAICLAALWSPTDRFIAIGSEAKCSIEWRETRKSIEPSSHGNASARPTANVSLLIYRRLANIEAGHRIVRTKTDHPGAMRADVINACGSAFRDPFASKNHLNMLRETP